jgi:O-antigen/teichoic acid export membrane protein
MLDKRNLRGASWTLADQAVVSLGAFLANVLLARRLPAPDYGAYSLLLGGFLTLQLFVSSLVLYPMSVRRSVLGGDDCARLMGVSLILAGGACVPLCAVLAVALSALGRADLLIPALACFLLSQLQQAARMGLLAEMRHHTALGGDTICYPGQVGAIAALGALDALTLTNALYGMAAMYGLAAAVQLGQLRIIFRRPLNIVGAVKDFWSIGGWSLGNNVVSILRVQVLLWMLAVYYGPATTGLLQAALNVVGVVNPIILGLCNVIPQTAARAQNQGKAHAWHAARPYAFVGFPPIVIFFGVLMAAPEIFLSAIYGPSWPYQEIVTAVRLLAIAGMVGYAAEMICSYLHGVDATKLAFVVNSVSTIAAAVAAPPLVLSLGLNGACLALVLASGARIAASQMILARMLADDRPRLA